MQAYSRAILIASSGRSGSSWFLDVLAKANRLRTVFEPLHPCMGEIASRYAGRFIPLEADEPELEEFIGRAISGRLRQMFPNYRVAAKRLLPTWKACSSRRGLAYMGKGYAQFVGNFAESCCRSRAATATKFIRANLMFGWIRRRFDVSAVHLVRNPVSVVASRLRSRKDWDPMAQIRLFTEDRALAGSGFLDRFAAGFRLAHESDVHAMAAVWCVENAIPLAQSDQNLNLVVHYEDLLTEAATWTSLAPALGLASIPDVNKIVCPSRLRNWKGELDDAHLRKIEAVLECFEIEDYSVTQARPVISTSLHIEPASTVACEQSSCSS